MEAITLRGQLRGNDSQPAGGHGSLWSWLRAQLDLAQYRPKAVPDAVASRLRDRQGPYVILKNPHAKTYFRIGDRDYYLWQKMDGTRTVKELVVAYFLEYKSFAFARVASLVQGLKQSQLLVDQPVNVYGQVYTQLARRRLSTRLTGLWAAFMGRQFAVGGLDGVLTRIYRWGGWLLYSLPALILYVLLSLGGLYCFFRVFRQGGYGVVSIAGSYAWGIVGLAVAYMLAIFIHELSHALTVKHYRREVRRGGFMLYMGMPGFFVDTTDIWMEGKRARLAVTWAGPFSGLILGGLASAIMVVWPSFALNAVLFQFAFMTYILVFLNLNPLLELDGYYLLMDGLEIPGLRRKSFEFLRTGLPAKLRGRETKRTPWQLLTSFTREEVIFTVFGVLSAAWTAYAIYAAATYYKERIAGAVRDLFAGGSTFGQILLAVIILLVSLPIVAGLAMGVWGTIRGLLRSAARHGLFRGWRLAATLLVVSVALAWLPSNLDYPELPSIVAAVALTAAAAFWIWDAVHAAGSRLAPAFWLLAAFATALALREAMTAVVNLLNPAVWSFWPALGLGLLSAACLFLAGLALFGYTDLKQLKPWEKALIAAALPASYGLLLAWAPPGVFGLTSPSTWVAPAALLSSWLALAFLVPNIVSFWRTSFAPAWALLALALVGLLVSSHLTPGPLPSYLLLAATAIAFHAGYRSAATGQAQAQATLDLTDLERLDSTFSSAVYRICREWRGLGGERETKSLMGEFNNHALAAGWHVQLKNGELEAPLPASLSLTQRGETYAAALTLLLDMMGHHVGEKLTVRALQRAYDGLPWDQREVAAQVLFPHVRRAEALSRDFRSTQQGYHLLLRRVPIFATMEEGELDLLSSRLRVERFSPGQTIIRQGDRGDRFYIIQRGHVEVTQRDAQGASQVVDQLERGDYFGEVALLNDAPRNATCRATVPTELLSLSRADFDQLIKHRFALRDKVDQALGPAALLRRVPLFADMDSHQIQLVAAQMREESYRAGDEIIRQGETGDTFYVIESGRVQTIVLQDGVERVVAERGPGEYVGEIALLMQVPRTATVRALTDVRVLALDRAPFEQLVASHLYVSRGLEREATRRLMGLRSPSPLRSGGD